MYFWFFMKLIKVANFGSYGAWLTPTGELVDVDYQDHEAVGIDILKRDTNYSGLKKGVYQDLYDLGYIRLAFSPFNMTWGAINSRQKGIIGRFVSNSDSDSFVISGPKSGTFTNKIDTNRFLSQI